MIVQNTLEPGLFRATKLSVVGEEPDEQKDWTLPNGNLALHFKDEEDQLVIVKIPYPDFTIAEDPQAQSDADKKMKLEANLFSVRFLNIFTKSFGLTKGDFNTFAKSLTDEIKMFPTSMAEKLNETLGHDLVNPVFIPINCTSKGHIRAYNGRTETFEPGTADYVQVVDGKPVVPVVTTKDGNYFNEVLVSTDLGDLVIKEGEATIKNKYGDEAAPIEQVEGFERVARSKSFYPVLHTEPVIEAHSYYGRVKDSRGQWTNGFVEGALLHMNDTTKIRLIQFRWG